MAIRKDGNGELTHVEARASPSRLALALALGHLLYFALLRSASYVSRARRKRRSLFPRGALGFLAFCSIFNMLCVHSILIPAYFATNFFSPYPGKLTVTLASSPEPSNMTMVPRPYFA